MLSPQWSQAADAALDRLRTATAQQVQAADSDSGFLDTAWEWIVGSESAASALHTNAHSAQVLLTVMEGKRWTLTNDEQAATFVRDCGQYSDVRDILETAHSLTAAGGLSEIGSETAKDLGDMVKGATPWLLLGAAALIALVVLKD